MENRGGIQVLLLGQFYCNMVGPKHLAKINKRMGTAVKVNSKGGCTLSWGKKGPGPTWELAKSLAKWI